VTQTKKKLSAPTAAGPVSSDVNKETGAEERFKEINRAYEVLSEPEIRSRYDRFGEAGQLALGIPGYRRYGWLIFLKASLVVLLAAGWRVKRSRRGGCPGDDLRLDLKLDFKEAVFGGEKEIRISP